MSQIKYIPKSAMIAWERPNCSGWEREVVHTIRVTTEDSLIERSTDKTSYALPKSVKGVVDVSLSVENTCGEVTVLDRQLVDTDSPGRGQLHPLLYTSYYIVALENNPLDYYYATDSPIRELWLRGGGGGGDEQ